MKTDLTMHASNTAKLICFPGRGEQKVLHPEHIIRLQADSNYTYVYSDTHRPFLMAKVLKEYERLLKPFDFIRINRSTLINRKRIASISHTGCITMDDNTFFQVPRRKRNELQVVLGPGIDHR